MRATPITLGGFEPYATPTDPEGKRWLYARYEQGDEPWHTWPKFVQYDGELFRWSCWNSDKMYVVYKEATQIDLAMPVIVK